MMFPANFEDRCRRLDRFRLWFPLSGFWLVSELLQVLWLGLGVKGA